jgi:hypothetical protein
MGFPKTIPTIPVPYKLRKKGLFETIDRECKTSMNNTTEVINIDKQIEDVNTFEQIEDVNTFEQIADVNKYEQIEDADIDDQVYQTYHTEISGHILTISL